MRLNSTQHVQIKTNFMKSGHERGLCYAQREAEKGTFNVALRVILFTWREEEKKEIKNNELH